MIHARRTIATSCRRHLVALSSSSSSSSSSWLFTTQPPLARHFSDNLLGHSPMAQITPPSSPNTTIPTAQDVTTAGGVWAPTSSKRDALGELKAAAATGDLDDEATQLEKLDLYLADGIQLIGRRTDQQPLQQQQQQQQLETWWNEEVRSLLLATAGGSDNDNDESSSTSLSSSEWEPVLNAFLQQTERQLAALQEEQEDDASLTYMQDIRDFLELPKEEWQKIDDNNTDDTLLLTTTTTTTEKRLNLAVTHYRLLLVQAAAEHLKKSWDLLTTVSDQDVDRAAVKGAKPPIIPGVPRTKLYAVLESFFRKNCHERVDALWDLVDWDDDGLLDQEGMNQVCELAVQPVGAALAVLMQQALEAAPVRQEEVLWVDKNENDDDNNETTAAAVVAPKLGWRQRRQEKKVRKKLTKMFQKTIRNHFRDEVELAHRLRCIYAWSNKEHQNNEIDSVLVDEAGWSGRKRYVELHPKISLAEFREVQNVHLTHLDRLSEEFLKSFREDLWVKQGKGRQNAELMRECGLFLAVVSVVDYIILCL